MRPKSLVPKKSPETLPVSASSVNNAIMDLILLLPSPEKERAFVDFSLHLEEGDTPSKAPITSLN